MLRLRAPSPALLISLIALFVALGGTTYAATSLPRNSVGTAQLKKNAVTGAKIADGAVTAPKIKTNGLTVPTATNALSLGGVAAELYIQGPVEPVHVVGTPTEPSFGTNWTNGAPGFQTVDFYKDPFGIVHLEGSVQHTGNVEGETVFTLPIGYRPSAMRVFPVQSAVPGSVAALRIDPDGSVKMFGVRGAGEFSLDGVTFRP